MFHPNNVIHRVRRRQIASESGNSGTQCRVAALGIKCDSADRRQREIKRVSARWRKRKNRSYRWIATIWSRSREAFKEHTRRIVPHLIDALPKHDPVVIHAYSATHTPVAGLGGIPCKADSRTPQITLRVRKY